MHLATVQQISTRYVYNRYNLTLAPDTIQKPPDILFLILGCTMI